MHFSNFNTTVDWLWITHADWVHTWRSLHGSACVQMCKVCLFDPCSLPCPKGGWPDHDVCKCNLAKSPKESVSISLHGLAWPVPRGSALIIKHQMQVIAPQRSAPRCLCLFDLVYSVPREGGLMYDLENPKRRVQCGRWFAWSGLTCPKGEWPWS